jgi:radical SAM protein with 4Fe4S-binding SPASM domain
MPSHLNTIKAIEIEINSNCNRSCSYCPNATQERIEQGDIHKDLFLKIIFELKQNQYKGRISFSFYNEPLLSKNIEYFATEVKKHLPSTTLLLYTNGTLLNKEKFLLLLKAGVDTFVVTKHEQDFKTSYLFDLSKEEIPSELYKKHIKFQHYSDLALTNRGGLVDLNYSQQTTINLPCFIPLNMITITNKGTVIPCFEDYHQKNTMGDLNLTSLSEVWNSEKYIRFRKKLALGIRKEFPVCSSCSRTQTLDIF